MKTKNGGKFHNRITFYDDYAVGQHVWLFYQHENDPPDYSRGIVAGKITGFKGFALDVAEILVEGAGVILTRTKCLNHIN